MASHGKRSLNSLNAEEREQKQQCIVRLAVVTTPDMDEDDNDTANQGSIISLPDCVKEDSSCGDDHGTETPQTDNNNSRSAEWRAVCSVLDQRKMGAQFVHLVGQLHRLDIRSDTITSWFRNHFQIFCSPSAKGKNIWFLLHILFCIREVVFSQSTGCERIVKHFVHFSVTTEIGWSTQTIKIVRMLGAHGFVAWASSLGHAPPLFCVYWFSARPSKALPIIRWGMIHYPVFHVMNLCESIENQPMSWLTNGRGIVDTRASLVGREPLLSVWVF